MPNCRHRDSHALHVVAVPQGLEKRVGKPEVEQVLYRLLAEKMVDAIDRRSGTRDAASRSAPVPTRGRGRTVSRRSVAPAQPARCGRAGLRPFQTGSAEWRDRTMDASPPPAPRGAHRRSRLPGSPPETRQGGQSGERLRIEAAMLRDAVPARAQLLDGPRLGDADHGHSSWRRPASAWRAGKSLLIGRTTTG